MHTARASLLVLVVALVASAGVAAAAPTVLTQFAGAASTNNADLITPPDVSIAVGPSHVFEVVNAFALVTDRSGAVLRATALSNLFPPDPWFDQTDPMIVYDPASNRWFGTYLEYDEVHGSSSILFVVSTSGDPTGSFCHYHVGNPAYETFIQDAPKLGVSLDKIVIAYNAFTFGSETFLGAGYYVINKSDALACATYSQVRVAPNRYLASLIPAQLSTSTSDLYMAMSDGSTVTIETVHGVPGVSSVTTTSATLTTAPWIDPPSAAQPGTSTRLDTGDARLQTVSWRGQSLWLAGNSACTWTGDSETRSCLRAVEVAPGSMTVRQDITYGIAGGYYFNPAVAADAGGNAYVVFSTSSSTEFFGIRVTGRLAGDALGRLQASRVVQAGAGVDTDPGNRTGDYAAAVIDPSDGTSVWVASEYNRATGVWPWATAIARVTFAGVSASSPGGPSISSLSPASVSAGSGGTTLTVVGSGFALGSVVQWNGSPRATVYLGSTELQATLTSADLAAPGTAAIVVSSAADGGGVSNTASFSVLPVVQLTVAVSGGGSVTSVPAGIACGTACSAQVQAGTAVALTATTAPGYRFVGWSAGCSGAGSCAVTVSSNTVVYATFAADSSNLDAGPAVASWQSGRLDVFMRGADNTLRHRYFAGAWSGWENLGGSLFSDPGVVSWGPGRLDIVVRGSDNAVWHLYYDNGWGAWESLGGTTYDRPVVASWGPGRLDVLVRGADNQLWHRVYDGGWSAWEPLGGALASAPAAIAFGVGHVDVFVQGLDNGLYQKFYTNGWSDWRPHGGILASAPGVASWGFGRMDVFARGSDGNLWHQWYDNAATTNLWESLGDAIATAPAAVSWAASRIDVFAGRADGTLLHKWFDGGWASEVMTGPP